jgi:sugar lactone lactonase YvrE
MYFTHSTPQQVLAFDYDTDKGVVTNQRVFYQHQGSGDPDGFRVDVDGNIWHAVYGESRVLKISPEGKLVGQITLPTRNITCVEFVGTELIITTASDDDSPDGSKSKALGGAVFRVDVGVKGLEPFDFKL